MKSPLVEISIVEDELSKELNGITEYFIEIKGLYGDKRERCICKASSIANNLLELVFYKEMDKEGKFNFA